MKKAFKKILATVLATIIIFTGVPLSGFVGIELPEWLDFSNLFITKASAESNSGTCGDNLTWSFDKTTSSLTISGEGEMKSKSSYTWSQLKPNIKHIKLENGVQSVGRGAFEHCYNLLSVDFSDSIKKLKIMLFITAKT